jgi:hypothetical protein
MKAVVRYRYGSPSLFAAWMVATAPPENQG